MLQHDHKSSTVHAVGGATQSAPSHELPNASRSASGRRHAEVVHATRLRQRAATAHGIPHEEVATYQLTILPLNGTTASPLPVGRRTEFEQQLRRRLAQAREGIACGDFIASTEIRTASSAIPNGAHTAEARLLDTACASCRGKCCTKGGNHAFISAATLVRFIEQFPLLGDDAIVMHYLSFVAEDTLTDGCIYQGATGCTLRRDLRSDLCNRYYCGDISVFKRQLVAGDPVRAFIVNRDGGRLIDGRFVAVAIEECSDDGTI